MARMRRRADNTGMHMIRGGSPRPYGICPVCKQMKPIHWISRVDFRCHTCLKKSGLHPFIPPLGAPNQELQDHETSTPKRPGRARPLYRRPPQPRKHAPKKRKKQKHAQKPSVGVTHLENECLTPPAPEVLALWNQRRASVEDHAEKLRQERLHKQKELEQRLAQDDRPLPERVREYRRHRWTATAREDD